jgi:copper chaperone
VIENLSIRGMSCERCVMSVTGALKRLPGVKAVKVSLAEQQAEISFDESVVSLQDMRQAVEDVGFEAY